MSTTHYLLMPGYSFSPSDYGISGSLCYHGMVCPWVADRGYDLQIWSLTVNILNKQLWKAGKGSSFSLGVK